MCGRDFIIWVECFLAPLLINVNILYENTNKDKNVLLFVNWTAPSASGIITFHS